MGFGKTIAEGDALKLSQVPLNHMFACALKAGSPLKQSDAKEGEYNPFKIDPKLQVAYDDFLRVAQMHPRPLHQWLQPYINWKWEISKRLQSQGHWQRASPKDRELLHTYNAMLIEHAAHMDSIAARGKGAFLEIGKQLFSPLKLVTPNLDPEARRVYAAAKTAPPTSPEVHAMFDGYVHDSLAGFNKALIEWTGYWRYRKGFLGSRKGLIAAVDENPEKPVGSYT